MDKLSFKEDRHFECRDGCGRWLAFASLAVLSPWVMAQEKPLSSPITPDEQQQRLRTEQQAQERTARAQAPAVHLGEKAATDFHSTTLPTETPCFTFTQIHLQGERSDAFGFVQRYLNTYAGRCVGHQGISLIVRRAGDLILDRGYVTTRVGLAEQDLSKGVLTITLVPGVLHGVRMADGTRVGDWHFALPVRAGDLLNLRDIEQGMEQFKRVPSQDVTIDIAPTERPGQSDLVITVKRSKPWRMVATLDDSGASATGLYQAGLNAGIDNPLNANDMLSLGVSHDAWNGDGHGTQGYNANYSIPRGNWLFTAGVYGYRYHQTVPGSAQTFLSSGTTRSVDLAAQRLLFRNRTSKTTAEVHLGKRWAHSYIENVELNSQRRDMSMLEAAIAHRHYLGSAQLDLRVAERFGVPWFGGQRDPVGHTSNDPTFRYHLTTFDASLNLPFALAGQRTQWASELHGQYSPDTLYASEFIGLGGRYTIRGFDGDQTLAAERGVYWRNTFSMPISRWPLAWYVGVDAGRASGPGTAYIPGNTTLAGGFFGLRGSYRNLSWDAFVGKAIHGGDLLPNARPASGFQLIYYF
jgi:hemolysin activation/secretion protein